MKFQRGKKLGNGWEGEGKSRKATWLGINTSINTKMHK